jgi:hypothetical protein
MVGAATNAIGARDPIRAACWDGGPHDRGGGELRPGDRLPEEADMALRLGLSRSSLREG